MESKNIAPPSLLISTPLDGTENVCPDKATDTIVDNPVLGRDKLEVDGLGGQPPATTHLTEKDNSLFLC